MTAQDYISFGALIVAALSLLSNALWRRGQASSAALDAIRAEAKKAETECETQFAQVHAELAKLNYAGLQLKLDMATKLVDYATRQDFEVALDRALEPIMAHVSKTEVFMNRVLESGALTTHHRRGT